MSAVAIETADNGDEKANWLELVRQQVGSSNYGVVQIVVHDSYITQIEMNQRLRLDKLRTKSTPPTRNLEA